MLVNCSETHKKGQHVPFLMRNYAIFQVKNELILVCTYIYCQRCMVSFFILFNFFSRSHFVISICLCMVASVFRQWLLLGPSPFLVNVNMSFCGDITCWVEARQRQQLGFKLQPQKHISLVFLVPHIDIQMKVHPHLSIFFCSRILFAIWAVSKGIMFSCRGEK